MYMCCGLKYPNVYIEVAMINDLSSHDIYKCIVVLEVCFSQLNWMPVCVQMVTK